MRRYGKIFYFLLNHIYIYYFKEWIAQEKSRPEVRNMIKRDFDAMIKKEREMKNKMGKQRRLITNEGQDQMFTPKPKSNVVKNELKQVILDEVTEEKENVELKNFHGDHCKTCVRMKSMMDSILPHPINV